MRAVVGNMFEGVPRGGDVYLLANILHDWDDERAARILSRVVLSAPKGSRVLIVEGLEESFRNDKVLTGMDLQLMTTMGGQVRSRRNMLRLLGSAGIDVQSVGELIPEIDVIEGAISGHEPTTSASET